MPDISEGTDVIDSHDIIARIEELEDEKNVLLDDDTPDWEAEEGEELAALKALQDEAEGSPDWIHGETLIADHYFEEYAEQLADDIGAIDRDASWPVNHIDWKAAADSLKQDYMSVTYGSTEYWIRN